MFNPVMKFKTILFSFTSLIALSSASYGANVAIAEPEPVEYMRVCDAYGAGYFYIPGTETCMRLSGYVRFDTKAGDNVYAYKGNKSRDTYNIRTRAELRFQTARETEFGTLSTLVELRNQWDDGQDSLAGQAHFAYIDLAGVRVGVDESIFWHWTGYLGKVLNDDIVDPGAYQRTNVLSYTFAAGNGFSAIVGLEQGTNDGSDNAGKNYYIDGYGQRISQNNGAAYTNIAGAHQFSSGSKIDDYAPNVIVGAKFVQGWGGISAVGAYDAQHDDFAAKIRLDANITEGLTAWVMAGYKTHDDYYAYDTAYNNAHPTRTHDYYYRMHTNQYGDWGGHVAVWGGGTFKMTSKASLNTQLTYDETHLFTASANVAYKIVDGLIFTPEISYVNFGNDKKWDDGARVTFHGDHAVQGMVRLQRNF